MICITQDFGELYLFERDLERFKSKKTAKMEDLLHDLVTYLPEGPSPPAERIPDFFAYKSKRLQESLSQLNKEMETRLELRDRSFQKLDYQITEAASSLKEFSQWGLGYNVGVDVKRNFLEKMLAELRKERRREELSAWEDVVALRKERRRIEDELSDLSRKEMLINR